MTANAKPHTAVKGTPPKAPPYPPLATIGAATPKSTHNTGTVITHLKSMRAGSSDLRIVQTTMKPPAIARAAIVAMVWVLSLISIGGSLNWTGPAAKKHG